MNEVLLAQLATQVATKTYLSNCGGITDDMREAAGLWLHCFLMAAALDTALTGNSAGAASDMFYGATDTAALEWRLETLGPFDTDEDEEDFGFLVLDAWEASQLALEEVGRGKPLHYAIGHALTSIFPQITPKDAGLTLVAAMIGLEMMQTQLIADLHG